MLKEKVIDALKQEFGPTVKLEPISRKFAIFDAKHPDVGKVVVEENGSELILSIGNITHGHFGSYDSDLSDEEHASVIAESLVDFLRELFADNYFLFKSARSGGWARLDMIKPSDMLSPNTAWYKWSGPVHRTIDTY